MCAAVVLRSHDCLQKLSYCTRRNTNNLHGSRRRKRGPTGSDTNVHQRSGVVVAAGGNNNRPDLRKSRPTAAAKSNLVMGQVKILKRGEPMPDDCDSDDNKKAAPEAAFRKLGSVDRRDEDDLILCSTGRLGPEPDLVQKQIRASDFYAGSGPVVASPPPSSLPFPAFFSKKEKKIDEATSDLLRLLRLDLA